MGVLIICKLPYTGPMDWFKETSSFDFDIFIKCLVETKNIFSFLIPMFSPKANMNIYYFLYQPHGHMYVQYSPPLINVTLINVNSLY